MTTALSRSSHPPRASNESVISDVRTTSSPSSSPNMSGQRSSGGGGGRIGLSEYTAQRLAELRARRAEVEADFKQGGTTTASSASIPPQHPAPPTTVSSLSSSSSSSSFSSSSTAVVVQSTPQPPKPPKPSAVWNNPTRHGSEVTQLTSGGGGLSRSSVVVNGDSPPPPAVDPPFVRRRPLDCADAAVVVTRPTEPAPPVPPAAPRRSTTTTTVSNARSVAAEVSNGFAAAAAAAAAAAVRTQQSPSSVGGEKKPGVPRYSPSPSHSRSGAEDDDEVIGFASLPEQVHRKAVKRGFDFTLMVVGDSGLGKSTLISCLFMNNDLYKGRIVTTAEDRILKTVAIDKKCVDIEERGVKLRLTIVDTPGFNETIDAADCWRPIEDYIEQQYEQYLNDENGLNRKNIVDSRVHCCLYFLSPCSHGMRQVDVEVMQRLQRKVNLVPIIAKSDTLTPTETKRLKSRIRAEIEKHKIRIYEFPDCDSDEDEEFKKQDADLKSAVPFAVVGSNTVVEVGGRKLRGRPYPWGVVEVDNPSHSDFAKLRQFLISTHMQDLKDVTRDVHYENYRARHIQEQMIQSQKERKLKRDSVANFDAVANADEILLQKDQELEQMREMLKKMESQLTGNRGVSDIKGLGNL